MSENHRYSYRKGIKFSLCFGTLVSILFFIASLNSCLNIFPSSFELGIENAQSDVNREQSEDSDRSRECNFFSLIFFAFVILYLPNSYPDVKVDAFGLYVQYFSIYWKFIPWEEVNEIRNGLPYFPGMIVVVFSNRLPLFYSLFGLSALHLKPGFNIWFNISNHHSLVKLIREKMNE